MDQKNYIPQRTQEKDSLEISFSPVTEGLGFHPFSDGLPYAPISKTNRNQIGQPSQRSSTITASPPRFSSPTQHIPGSGLRPTPHSAMTPALPLGLPKVSPPLIPSKLDLVSESKQSQSTESVQKFGLSYLVKRLGAYLLDFIFNSFVLTGALAGIFWFHELDPKILLNRDVFDIGLVALVILNWILISLQEIVFRTSIGKYFFRLMLPCGRFRILLRTLFFVPSVGIAGLGLLWSVIDRRKCCLHDRITGVQPIEVAQL